MLRVKENQEMMKIEMITEIIFTRYYENNADFSMIFFCGLCNRLKTVLVTV